MLTDWSNLEIAVWAAAAEFFLVDLGFGIAWMNQAWKEHLATCERCYRRRHPQQQGRGTIPDSPALRRTLVDATAREVVASTGPQRRVEATLPVRASAPRPWAAGIPAGTAAHTVAVGSASRRRAEPTAGGSRG